MNASRTSEPETPSALDEREEFVGVALQTAMPVECNLLTVQLFWAVMDSGVRRMGIEPSGSGGLFRPCFAVWALPTLDRNPLLRAIERVIKEDLDFWPWENFEVAFYDSSEGCWRTVHPSGAPPFARFLTKENFQATREAVGLVQEELINGASDLRRYLREIRGQNQ